VAGDLQVIGRRDLQLRHPPDPLRDALRRDVVGVLAELADDASP
jgi:hypothetical protein